MLFRTKQVPKTVAVGRVKRLAIGAQSVGAFAVGAMAISAFAIGAIAIGRLAIGKARIKRLEIDELGVGKLRLRDVLETPSAGARTSTPDKLFYLTDKEFGDTYHVAAALVLCASGSPVEVVVAPGRKAAAIYHFLRSVSSVGLLEREPSVRRADPLPDATDLISAWAESRAPGEKSAGIREIRRRFLQSLSRADKNAVEQFLLQKPNLSTSDPKVLIWIRNDPDYARWRNTTAACIQTLADEMKKNKLSPVLVGHGLASLTEDQKQWGQLVEFFEDDTFKQDPKTSIARQLWMFELLKSSRFNIVAQIGMVSGGMDGPALLGLPTVEFAPSGNACRMHKFETLLEQSFRVVDLGESYSNQKPFADLTDDQISEMVDFLNPFFPT